MWELDNTEGWLQKNWCLQIVKPEKTLESSLDGQEIKPVNPEGNQPWIFIGQSNAKAEAPILWPLDAKNRLIGKDTDVGKGWRQKEKGAKEDEMVTWHHWFNGREFEQILGNPMNRGAWQATVHGVSKSQIWLSFWRGPLFPGVLYKIVFFQFFIT